MTNNLEADRLRQVRECLRLFARIVPAWMIELLQDLIDDKLSRLAERPVIVFKPVCRHFGSETWAIHRAGEPERVYPYNDIGLTPAWLAIRDQGLSDTVRTGDFAAPGANQPDTVLRKAIRETALQWVERTTGCAELALAMRAISVERGHLRYRPKASAPIFDTGG